MSAQTRTPDVRRSVLRFRNYRLFLLARLFLTSAVQIQSVAVGWQVYDLSGSPLALGYVGLAQFLPMMVLILPAGELADRFNRRTLLVIACLLEASVAVGFLVLTLLGTETLWPYYSVLALFGIVRALSAPASQSLIPLLVPANSLSRAIALNSSVFQTPPLSG